MSVDEDNELRELVSEALESNGILAKIRAELRASVFLALEEQDAFKDKPHLLNKALKEFVSTSEGAIVICLIREFLEFFGLEFTMAVFDPETQLGQDYEYVGRSKLAKDLKIKTVKKTTPLLVQVVQNACNSHASDDDESSSRTDVSTKEDALKSVDEKTDVKLTSAGSNAFSGLNKSDNLSNSKHVVSFNGPLKQVEKVKEPNLDNKQPPLLNEVQHGPQIQHNLLSQPNIRKSDSLKLDINQTSIKPSVNNNGSLSSLGGLPPISPLTNGQVGNNFLGVGKQIFSQKDVTNDIKALLDQGLSDSQDNNYEEDFHSSTSDKTKKGQMSASGSEIEEDISSAGDDQTSISGGGDEVTIDTTISQASGHGDYLENI